MKYLKVVFCLLKLLVYVPIFFNKKSTVNYIPCSGDFGFLFGYKYWNQTVTTVTVPIVNTALLFFYF